MDVTEVLMALGSAIGAVVAVMFVAEFVFYLFDDMESKE